MRCEEFRDLCKAEHFGDLSRAERAAFILHNTHCKDCNSWAVATQPQGDELELRKVRKILDSDMFDPEFLEVIGGGRVVIRPRNLDQLKRLP